MRNPRVLGLNLFVLVLELIPNIIGIRLCVSAMKRTLGTVDVKIATLWTPNLNYLE